MVLASINLLDKKLQSGKKKPKQRSGAIIKNTSIPRLSMSFYCHPVPETIDTFTGKKCWVLPRYIVYWHRDQELK